MGRVAIVELNDVYGAIISLHKLWLYPWLCSKNLKAQTKISPKQIPANKPINDLIMIGGMRDLNCNALDLQPGRYCLNMPSTR